MDVIEFVWDADIKFDYDKFYTELVAYQEEFGDLLVHAKYINETTGYKLGQTVNSIRIGKKVLDEWKRLSEEEKSKAKKPREVFLQDEEYKQLINIGFVWEVDRSFDYEEFYNELIAYKKQFGNFEGSTTYTNKKTGYKLGSQVSNIRQGKKKLDKWNALSEEEKLKTKNPTGYILTESQYKQLDDIEFDWGASRSFDYDKIYTELIAYKEEFGNLLVTAKYINEKTGDKLGQIVSGIRTGKKKLDEWNALSEEEKVKTKKPTGYILPEGQYKQLTDAGFVWEVRKKKKGGTEQEVEQGLSM